MVNKLQYCPQYPSSLENISLKYSEILFHVNQNSYNQKTHSNRFEGGYGTTGPFNRCWENKIIQSFWRCAE